MPRQSQLMIRTALLWLALGSTLGGLVLANKGIAAWPWLWALRGSHVHTLLIGWTVQLACGVAYWILPRLDAHGSRGRDSVMWLSYLTLNGGVLLGAMQGPVAAVPGASAGAAYMLAGAGALYLTAAVLFLQSIWPRIVPFRSLPRP
jgi:hypothetical protein